MRLEFDLDPPSIVRALFLIVTVLAAAGLFVDGLLGMEMLGQVTFIKGLFSLFP
jgi:hypothetical protein